MRKRARSCAVLTVFLVVYLTNSPVLAKKWPVYAKHGMVVSTNRLASEIGMRILKQGGNAVDAAVATGFALAVVDIKAGNIGGGGFMVIRLANGKTTTIDYRETAPMAAHEKMYLDATGKLVKNLNHEGYLAVGVPGTVAGFALALKEFGTMSLAQVLEPAIRLAESGFPMPYALSQDFVRQAQRFKKYPSTVKVFYKKDGQPYQPGEIFVQRDLAETLKRIAKEGRDGFYKGKTAELIARQMRDHGGLITKADLAAYKAVLRDPIVTTYRGYTIYSMPPPSSGGVTLALMLNMLERYDLSALGHNSSRYIHLLTEVMRRAYAERARYLGDPDFNPDMPVSWLISKKHAEELARTIDLHHASQSTPTSFDFDLTSKQTTHFSVVDAQGNAVSNTYTLEYFYGSGIVVDGAGFLLNNEMGDFNPWPGHTDTLGLIGTRPNLVQPGKRMLSSMTPTIVAKGDQLFMVTGSPGGRTIIATVLHTILNVIDHGMNIFEAIDAPRFYHQWLPDVIRIEKWGTTTDTVERLEKMGHRVKWVNTQGRAMGILIEPESGYRTGAADPRSELGEAIGY
ncbi:MAG: gamma-glutamyltransferase [Calditrichaeota bacterium]|nr:MAG: gamma-glutamyltransferase [Calditrichota bacterium]